MEVDQISTQTEAFPGIYVSTKTIENTGETEKYYTTLHLWLHDAIHSKIISICINMKHIYWSDIKRRILFNSWITRCVRNKLLWALRYANVSLGCRHRS